MTARDKDLLEFRRLRTEELVYENLDDIDMVRAMIKCDPQTVGYLTQLTLRYVINLAKVNGVIYKYVPEYSRNLEVVVACIESLAKDKLYSLWNRYFEQMAEVLEIHGDKQLINRMITLAPRLTMFIEDRKLVSDEQIYEASYEDPCIGIYIHQRYGSAIALNAALERCRSFRPVEHSFALEHHHYEKYVIYTQYEEFIPLFSDWSFDFARHIHDHHYIFIDNKTCYPTHYKEKIYNMVKRDYRALCYAGQWKTDKKFIAVAAVAHNPKSREIADGADIELAIEMVKLDKTNMDYFDRFFKKDSSGRLQLTQENEPLADVSLGFPIKMAANFGLTEEIALKIACNHVLDEEDECCLDDEWNENYPDDHRTGIMLANAVKAKAGLYWYESRRVNPHLLKDVKFISNLIDTENFHNINIDDLVDDEFIYDIVEERPDAMNYLTVKHIKYFTDWNLLEFVVRHRHRCKTRLALLQDFYDITLICGLRNQLEDRVLLDVSYTFV